MIVVRRIVGRLLDALLEERDRLARLLLLAVHPAERIHGLVAVRCEQVAVWASWSAVSRFSPASAYIHARLFAAMTARESTARASSYCFLARSALPCACRMIPLIVNAPTGFVCFAARLSNSARRLVRASSGDVQLPEHRVGREKRWIGVDRSGGALFLPD